MRGNNKYADSGCLGRTWDLFGPANQNQQLPVQEVTEGQQGPQAAVIGRLVMIGGQRGGLSEQQVRDHLVS